jgi:hypothetical protein
MIVFAIAAILTISGLVSTYVGVGLARSTEQKRGYEECEDRLDVLRRQLRNRGLQ